MSLSNPAGRRPISRSHRALRWILGLAVAAAVPIALPSSAMASHRYEDWEYQRDRLRSEIDVAEYQVRRALSDAEAARMAMDIARGESADLNARLAGADRARAEAVGRIDEIDTAMARMAADREQVARDRVTVQAAASPILSAHAVAVAAKQKAEADAVTAFEAGVTFRNAADRAGVARRELALAEQAMLDALVKTPEFARADYEARSADAIVQALRGERPPGDPALAGVSQQAIDARNRLEAMKRSALDADPRVVTAREQFTIAERVIAILRAEFAKVLPTEPAVVAAAAQIQQIQPDFDRATGDLKAADDRIVVVDGVIARATADRQNAFADVARIDDDMARMRGGLAAIDARIADGAARQDGALTAADEFGRTRDQLIFELQSMELARPRPVFVPVCPPAYACPPPVLCPPEPIFVPPPRIVCPPSFVIVIGSGTDGWYRPPHSHWRGGGRNDWRDEDNSHGHNHNRSVDNRSDWNDRDRSGQPRNLTPDAPRNPSRPVQPPRERTVIVKAENARPFVGPAMPDRVAPPDGPSITGPSIKAPSVAKGSPRALSPAPGHRQVAATPNRLSEIAAGRLQPTTPADTTKPSTPRPFVGPTTLDSNPGRFVPPEGLRPILPNGDSDNAARTASARIAAQHREQQRVMDDLRKAQVDQTKALKDAKNLAAKQKEQSDKLDRERTDLARQRDVQLKQEKERQAIADKAAKALADKEKSLREEAARTAAEQSKRDAGLKKLRDAEQVRIRADDAERARQSVQTKKLADESAKREMTRLKDIEQQRIKEGQLIDLQKRAAEEAKKNAAETARREADRARELSRIQDQQRVSVAAQKKADEEARKQAVDSAKREAARSKELDLQRMAAEDARREAAEANQRRLAAERDRENASRRQAAEDARRQDADRRAATEARAEQQRRQAEIKKLEDDAKRGPKSGRR